MNVYFLACQVGLEPWTFRLVLAFYYCVTSDPRHMQYSNRASPAVFDRSLIILSLNTMTAPRLSSLFEPSIVTFATYWTLRQHLIYSYYIREIEVSVRLALFTVSCNVTWLCLLSVSGMCASSVQHLSSPATYRALSAFGDNWRLDFTEKVNKMQDPDRAIWVNGSAIPKLNPR